MYGGVNKLTMFLAIFVSKCISISNVCESKTCENESANLLSYMDKSIDPCENFYDFACGTFIKNTVLPKDKSSYNSVAQVKDIIIQRINEILSKEAEPNESTALELTKKFFHTCVDTETLNKVGIDPMVELLNKYGGWPVITNDWDGTHWDWLKVKQQSFDDGFWMTTDEPDDSVELILTFLIQPDQENSSKYSISVNENYFD